MADKYYKATRQLGAILAKNNISVIYGGGAIGLMGALAEEILKLNGQIEGVIPEFMMKVEWGNRNVKKMTIVKDMHERKKLLIKNTDAIIALPGGTGTLEELIEVISMKRLGILTKPVIIINTDGFYDGLISFFEKMIKEKFIRTKHRRIWTILEHPRDIIPGIHNSAAQNNNILH